MVDRGASQLPDRTIGVLLNVPEDDAEAQAWLTGLRKGSRNKALGGDVVRTIGEAAQLHSRVP